ncbi:MAG TPA: PTS sugar transporter subunit IIC [Candidatus Atopostipes pullistercoris]|uniref:Permease IIC component n=1 Tax=Candidatus Atopostipes pullistercoris TaxID=2838467 RepID=A0A9D2JZ26_9LACT|nr:PTS sugar transporter subunit IIC [Candidatus Atopostipes pullistercoris]
MMIDVLERVLMPLAQKIGNNKYLLAIRDGFLISMPLLIVGSFFLLFANFPIPGWADFWAGIFGENWVDFFSKPTDATFSILAVLTVLGIGYSFARQMEVNPIFGAVISLVNWFLLMPYEVAGDEVTLAGIPLQWVGSQGVFLSIIVAIISVHIYTWVENKGWVIHMPEGVPPQVERSFSALIPSGVSLLVFFFINILFGITSYGNAFSFVYEILQIPLLALGNTLPAMVVAYLFLHFFWFFGINGGSVVGAVFNPILQTLSAENLSAYRAGEELPNIINQQFQDLFATFGGAGSTLSLLIAMFLFCKSKRITELGKLSILPGFFGINEPIVFGLPIVLNPMMLIPFVFVPTINIIISYAAMAAGLVPYTSGVAVPWTMPVVISGFLSTGWRGALLQALLLILGVGLYYPFIRVLDRQYLEDEKQAAKA